MATTDKKQLPDPKPLPEKIMVMRNRKTNVTTNANVLMLGDYGLPEMSLRQFREINLKITHDYECTGMIDPPTTEPTA